MKAESSFKATPRLEPEAVHWQRRLLIGWYVVNA